MYDIFNIRVAIPVIIAYTLYHLKEYFGENLPATVRPAVRIVILQISRDGSLMRLMRNRIFWVFHQFVQCFLIA